MPLTIIHEDITQLKVDAIVNAANTDLLQGGGVCGAIFKAAGASQLQAACSKLAPINTGEAVITEGFNLAAKYIIHAVGPIYSQWSPEESKALLSSAYLNSLKIAEDDGLDSIAFPLISSGIYGYPKEEALQVATEAITDYIKDSDLEVYLTFIDKGTWQVDGQLLKDVEDYVEANYFETVVVNEAIEVYESPILKTEARSVTLEAWVEELEEPFSQMLLKLIDSKGTTDVEVYKRANLDRKLFSKIRTGKDYIPSKRNVIALGMALELSSDEMEDFLGHAGYALSPSLLFDVIIGYFVESRRYNVHEINQVLFEYDLPLLGGSTFKK